MNSAIPITSKSNARVKMLRGSFDGTAAGPGDVLGIEGEHLIGEAVRSGLRLQTVFVREGSEGSLDRLDGKGFKREDVLVLSREVFASAVGTASPQGLAATLLLPPPARETAWREGAVLIVENLQDPGNFGTLIRSAEAFGAQRIFASPGTVNQWNSKVVRASAGSAFRVPVMRSPMKEIVAELMRERFVLYAAVGQDIGSQSVLGMEFASRCGLMIGNEGAGLSAEAQQLAHCKVRIPCAVESLNAAVAGSVLLYEAMRQRVREKLQETVR